MKVKKLKLFLGTVVLQKSIFFLNNLTSYSSDSLRNNNTSMYAENFLNVLDRMNCDCFSLFGIFIDYSKAFDMKDYRILLRNLEPYGIRRIPIELFKNYLINRRYNGRIGESCFNHFVGNNKVYFGP